VRPGVGTLASVLMLCFAAEAGGGEPDRAAPVVVELFTSQGCSSCPPADRLLAALAGESPGEVVALAFHVDSWNHAGWTDPFSSAAWTRRHAAYARALRSEGAYTPQAVVNGVVEAVGSDAVALRAAIADAAKRPAGRLTLELEPEARSVAVRVLVDLPPALRERRLDLLLAVYETGLETPVGRGENGGKRLRDDYVVRSLERVGRLAAERAISPGMDRFESELRLAEGWERSHLGVAAFLQDPRTLGIHGATARGLEPPQ
jgi:hypothetical protein